MIVVSDTTPLNYLIQLGHDPILAKLYGQLRLPWSVFNEMQHPSAPQPVRKWCDSTPPWVEVVSVTQLDETLPRELGAGEREAISLARALRANLLLIDERAGRRAAEERGLTVTGTLGILLLIAVRNRISLLEELSRLRGLGFWLSTEVEATLLRLYREQLASPN